MLVKKGQNLPQLLRTLVNGKKTSSEVEEFSCILMGRSTSACGTKTLGKDRELCSTKKDEWWIKNRASKWQSTQVYLTMTRRMALENYSISMDKRLKLKVVKIAYSIKAKKRKTKTMATPHQHSYKYRIYLSI